MPVLAAIQGGCSGAGVDMISACDVRYATEDAFFCIQEINLGLTAEVGTLQRLPKLISNHPTHGYVATCQAGMFLGSDMAAEAFAAWSEGRKPVDNPRTRREA
jgi:enoyl-CoA hydratase/carnithine racemase